MEKLSITEKQKMFQRALSNNPNLTFEEFETNLQKHRNTALQKANPKNQRFRTVNDVVTEFKSRDELYHTFTESDSLDNEDF